MGKTKKYEKRWEDDNQRGKPKPDNSRNQKRLKNALRSNNIKELINHDED